MKIGLVSFLMLVSTCYSQQFSWNPIYKGSLKSTVLPIEFPASVSDELYRHHPYVSYVNGVVYVSWSVHDTHEDGKGQYVKWGIFDGTQFTNHGVLFAGFDNVDARADPGVRVDGLCLHPGEFVSVGGKTYATALNNRRTVDVFAGYGIIAREVNGVTLGPVFSIDSDDGEGAHDNDWPPNATDPTFTAVAGLLDSYFSASLDRLLRFDFQNGAKQTVYVEPSGFLLDSGDVIRLWRSEGGGLNLLHEQINSGSMVATAIPNDPSSFHLLRDGDEALLVGNLSSSTTFERSVLSLAVASLQDMDFDEVYRISSAKRDPTYRYMSSESVDFRIGGPSYSHVVVAAGKVYCVYSVHKERIMLAVIDRSLPIVEPSDVRQVF